MKKAIALMFLLTISMLAMGQAAGGQIKRPVKEATCPTCKKAVSKCAYKGKHPKEATCPTCKKLVSKCTFKGKHPVPKPVAPTPVNPVEATPVKQVEAAGYDVTFTSNVPSAQMSIDGVASGSASGSRFLKTGSHNIQLTADGYEPLTQSIQVNSSSRSFAFTMKKKENQLPAVIQNLINNMVRVEGGTFTMGATSEQGSSAARDEKPAHQVTLSSFSIGKYEVTQEEWEAVMGSNPSNFKGAKRPVENVSWNDCQEFIRKLNAMTGKHFRLPTEAEWEYAARGGNRGKGNKYAGSDSPDRVAWYDGNSGSSTHDVGQKSPNELGLYDMSGNVWEWCQDWKGNYNGNSKTNPQGPSSGSDRVDRGGSWDDNARCCRISYRDDSSPESSFFRLGLRLAL